MITAIAGGGSKKNARLHEGDGRFEMIWKPGLLAEAEAHEAGDGERVAEFLALGFEELGDG